MLVSARDGGGEPIPPSSLPPAYVPTAYVPGAVTPPVATAGTLFGDGDPARNPPILEIRDLAKSYGDCATVLRGVDLTIRSQERVALIGANGSGKSTLLKCLIGLHPISGGTVEALGEQFARLPSRAQRARLRRQAGFVFQKHCLVRRRSVLSNVIHGLLGASASWRGFAQAFAAEDWRRQALVALDQVNLADKAMDRADTLSGGQQQRVAIARALVRQPKLLIADEPAASLDPASGRDVMDLFGRLCRDQGITMLFTSHDMDHAVAFSDRVVALKGGRVHFDKPSRDVTERELRETFDGQRDGRGDEQDDDQGA